MDLLTFKASLLADNPPENLSVYLLALWYDAKGDWDRAHETIQLVKTQNAAWIHAYLHHKEGDIFNADYWYSKAGKTRPDATLEQEWNIIVDQLIEG